MATIAFVSEQDQHISSNVESAFTINCNPDLQSAKFDSCFQEQMASPHSTQYTEDEFSDVCTEIKRSNSASSKFYEEISSFEQIETANKSPKAKPSEMQEEEQIGSPESTNASPIRESDDTSPVNENEEAEEEDEIPELKDWNEKKEKTLKNLAGKCKYDWKKIAKKFNASENTQITPLTLKQKYKDLTKVAIPLRVKFTHEEDLQIAKYFEIYGCNWTQIAVHFNDRTAMMLKNRYYSHIRKKNLLASMLEEVKEVPTEETQNGVESTLVKKEEDSVINKSMEVEKETLEPSSDDSFQMPYRNFPRFIFNQTCYEIENAFPNELQTRITISNW